jgi:UDP-N-acetylmuramoyl-tripeptide--D-alanyl-D-alanine ligase
MRKNPNGSIIIDDAYNSNIRGAKMALEVLKNFEDKKRLVITPGIVDLGTKADSINEELGEYIAESADYVILVGKEQAKPIYKGLSNKKYPDEKICIAENLQEALDEMKKEMTENTVILLENDLPDNYL